MSNNRILCAHKGCSNYSESGCELWSECPVFQADNVTPKKDRSKYGAEKVTVLGMDFDSRKEARRWFELRALEQAGDIHNLRRQVSFELIPAQHEPDTVGKRGGIIRGKTLEKAVSYRADFVYQDTNGNTVIEDCKGMRTKEYIIKRKLLLWRYGIRIKET